MIRNMILVSFSQKFYLPETSSKKSHPNINSESGVKDSSKDPVP